MGIFTMTNTSTEKDRMKLEYERYINEHVANVQKACEKFGPQICEYLNIDYNLLLKKVKDHDCSKWSKEEFEPYRQYFNPVKGETKDQDSFDRAWNHHQKENDHHWQYWVLINDEDEPKYKAIKMCPYALGELVCDWVAMGMKFGTKSKDYYEKNKDRIIMHEDTRKALEDILEFVD